MHTSPAMPHLPLQAQALLLTPPLHWLAHARPMYSAPLALTGTGTATHNLQSTSWPVHIPPPFPHLPLPSVL